MGGIISSILAGILIEKDQERRLTSSWHETGTAVGFVREHRSETDVGLLQLDEGIVFENSFVGMNASAKTPILANTYVPDSFVTRP
ncbi:hypothetical protein F4861DRAFT_20505 [Xylaria intraflava]|nr:hypothetical protein F4861DRAFT_20505 [Xylaria intraflava]